MKLSVIIPAFNEGERIRETLIAVRTAAPGGQIIVVDDGSTDDTYKIAEASGADVVLRSEHKGKGDALNTGCKLADGNIILLLDADLGSSAVEAFSLLEPVIEGAADMTIAVFASSSSSGGGMGLAVGAARTGIKLITGRVMRAPLSGQRAISRDALNTVLPFSPGWGAEVSLTVKALQAGLRVLEVECALTHRVTGKNFKDSLHRAEQFFAILSTLINCKFRHR